jgi:hypothetical protein
VTPEEERKPFKSSRLGTRPSGSCDAARKFVAGGSARRVVEVALLLLGLGHEMTSVGVAATAVTVAAAVAVAVMTTLVAVVKVLEGDVAICDEANSADVCTLVGAVGVERGLSVDRAGGTGVCVCGTQIARLVHVCGATPICTLLPVWLGCVANGKDDWCRLHGEAYESRRWAGWPPPPGSTLPPGVRGGEGMRCGLWVRAAGDKVCRFERRRDEGCG